VGRQIWSGAQEIAPDDREKKIAVLRLLVAFAIVTRLYLRGEPVNAELQELMPSSQYSKLKTVDSPPLEIILLIGEYIQQQFDRKTMQPPQVVPLQQSINMLVDSWIGCERILKTPMPLAYAIHLKQLVFLFCVLLPFQIVGQIGWLTGPTLAVVSFTLFGIEKIGIEIENPFGYDPNDLPLDGICNNLRQSIEDIISFEPR
jgi:putative membrane protein